MSSRSSWGRRPTPVDDHDVDLHIDALEHRHLRCLPFGALAAERTAEAIAAHRRKPTPPAARNARRPESRAQLRAGRPPEVPKMPCASAPAYEPITSPRRAIPASRPRPSSQPHARRTPSPVAGQTACRRSPYPPAHSTPCRRPYAAEAKRFPTPNRSDVLPADRPSRRHAPRPTDSPSSTTGVSLRSSPPHSARSPITSQRFHRRRASPAPTLHHASPNPAKPPAHPAVPIHRRRPPSSHPPPTRSPRHFVLTLLRLCSDLSVTTPVRLPLHRSTVHSVPPPTTSCAGPRPLPGTSMVFGRGQGPAQAAT
ncbi:MAG: hypothetical protein QOH72_3952, partial [Solirubrobacteraceae bacterium]|nr:hypothetical protein [Solirubrobacteraceae bacterium]